MARFWAGSVWLLFCPIAVVRLTGGAVENLIRERLGLVGTGHCFFTEAAPISPDAYLMTGGLFWGTVVAKKRTLRTLSSEVPAPETVEQVLLHLHGRQDREAAIVGASLVESALQERLLRSFDSAASGLEQSLFEDRGPLSDFNSKILVAQAFAVIPDRLAQDMQRIRKIRNCFAHARIDVGFDEPLIAKEVLELAAAMAVQSSMEKHPDSYPPDYGSAKTSFGLSCYITYTMLRSEAFAAVMRGTTSKAPETTAGR